MSMPLIIDLLIEKLLEKFRKEKEEDFDNRIPLYVNDLPEIKEDEKEDEKKSVIIIDL
jgi:hypothetical protein